MWIVKVLTALVVVVGAVNWCMIGLFQLDLVSALAGRATMPTRVFYIVAGVAGFLLVMPWKLIRHRQVHSDVPLHGWRSPLIVTRYVSIDVQA